MAYIGRTKTPAPLTSADIPDGIVAAADLAPNSVDSSELVDGSIDTSHLSSSLTLTTPNLGTVATGNLSNTAIVYPAGHVIQVLQSKNLTEVSKSDTAIFDCCPFVVITPKSASSKFLVRGVVMGIQAGGGTSARLNVYLKRDSTTLTESGANHWNYNRGGGFAIEYLDSPATTAELDYKLLGSWPSHSSPSYINKDGNSGYSVITVMEIAG